MVFTLAKVYLQYQMHSKDVLYYHSCVDANHIVYFGSAFDPAARYAACIAYRHIPDDFKGSRFCVKSKQNVPLSRNPVNLKVKVLNVTDLDAKDPSFTGKEQGRTLSHRRLTKSLFVTVSRRFPPRQSVSQTSPLWFGVCVLIQKYMFECCLRFGQCLLTASV